MRKIDWDKAYGPQTEEFHRILVNAFEREENHMKRKSLTAIFLTALLIIALAVTAFAVANRAGLLDFFETWDNNDITQTPTVITHSLSSGAPLLVATFDDLIVTVTEAVGEGEWYYFNTTIELKPGVPGRVLCIDMPYEQYLDDDFEQPSYFVRSYMLHENAISSSGDWMANEDGSVSALSMLNIVEAADIAQMQCYITYVRSEPGELPVETESHTKYLPFTLPMAEPERASKLIEPVILENIGVQFDEILLKEVCGETYCFMYLQYNGGEAVNYKLPYGNHGLTIRVLDEDTREVIVPRASMEWVHDNLFYGNNLVELKEWPDALRIEIVDESNEPNEYGINMYGTALLELEDGRLDVDRVRKYRIMPNQKWDYRDMYFAWTDMSFVADLAYITTSSEEGVSVLADPTDPTSLIGHFYSGLRVSPNITFRDWTSIYFAGGMNTGIQGYIKTAALTTDADQTVEGLPVARIVGSLSGSVDVKMSPSKTSTTRTVLEIGEEIIIVGSMNSEWYQVAKTEDGWTKIIGYVPANVAELTGEHTSMK